MFLFHNVIIADVAVLMKIFYEEVNALFLAVTSLLLTVIVSMAYRKIEYECFKRLEKKR